MITENAYITLWGILGPTAFQFPFSQRHWPKGKQINKLREARTIASLSRHMSSLYLSEVQSRKGYSLLSA